MAAPSGISSQLGIGAESVFGTPVTVTRFFEHVSASLAFQQERIESQGLRAGLRVGRSSRWALGEKNVEGDIEFELANKNFGIWLEHMMGTIATSQPAVGTDPTVYEHLATPGDLTGKSLTVQVGKPDTGGTVRSFTYHGCKVNEWEIAASVGEIAMLTVSLLGEDLDTSTALATASYPSGDSLFVFTQGVLSIAGSGFDVSEVTLSGNNNLKDDRYFIGSALRKNPLENGFREYTGELTAEFNDLTAFTRFVNGTEAALTLFFTGATISNAYKYALEITTNVRFDGEDPEVSGPEVLEQPLSFKCLNSGAGDSAAISLKYRTTDSTP